MKARYYIALVCMMLGSAVTSQANLVINATFDPSLSDSNVQSAIQDAINVYESDFTNSIVVDIYFQAGGGLGESNFNIYDTLYSSFYDGLVANNSNPAAIAGLSIDGNPLATGGNNPVTGDIGIEMKSANERAVGINQAPGCHLEAGSIVGSSLPEVCGGNAGTAYDGIISFNTSQTSPPNTLNGSNYDLTSVAEHEIDEILGLGSALINCPAGGETTACANGGNINFSGVTNDTPFGDPTPEDLFRWNLSIGGIRTLSTNCGNPTPAYFSYSSGSTSIAQFNNSCNGNDFGDWLNGGPPRVQDAVGTPGQVVSLGASEIAALSAIGYIPTTQALAPEPALFFPVAGVIGFMLLRYRRRT